MADRAPAANQIFHPHGVHRYRSVVEGCAMAAEFRRSGLTVAAFARQQGVTRRMILYWASRESELAAAHRPQELVMVTAPTSAPAPSPTPTPTPTPAVQPRRSSADPIIELRLSDGSVALLRPGFDASLLRDVMRALAAPC